MANHKKQGDIATGVGWPCRNIMAFTLVIGSIGFLVLTNSKQLKVFNEDCWLSPNVVIIKY